MSSRDLFWFLAGAAVVGVVLGIHFMIGATGSAIAPVVHATVAHETPAASTPSSAGSMDEVTQKLAQRLASRGGTDDEWGLLAQSYDYLGRTPEAAAARAHTTPSRLDLKSWTRATP